MNLYPEEDETGATIKIYQLPKYFIWLIKEIFLANLQVAYIIIHPKLPIKPKLLSFITKLPSSAAKVILGNSITLTPGTLTIDIKQDEFIVHCLTPKSANALRSGEMQHRVMKLYGDESSDAVSEFKFFVYPSNKNTDV